MSYDLSAFRADTSPAEQSLVDVSGDGETVAGTEKLVQRFVLQLLTDKDQVPFSTQGSSFIEKLANGAVATETDVFLAFSASLGEVVTALQAEELDTDPNNERIASIRLLQLTLAPGTINLTVRLNTRAGESANAVLPLEFVLAPN